MPRPRRELERLIGKGSSSQPSSQTHKSWLESAKGVNSLQDTHVPAQELQTIPISWSFAVWGLDIVGPFKQAPGGFTHLFVAIDKFTKWIEAKLVATIDSDFCEKRGIKICYAYVAHPKSNGQVKRANGMILQGIKTRVFNRLHPYAGRWLQELPLVLWALRTSVSRATGQSPFFLVYEVEAVLPTKIDHESFRICNYNESTADMARGDDLNRL
ncbi:uncharacterized protein LOC102719918 [Oryza brachyantha]|uniref:uncharacterized protein LOC102719918 n=1 Tax=Oryza brachyantha TaxID=4533 RepID=UPI000776708E|nr:uncharacterized protein LOC102719918 [Oryza brachyantha]